MKTVYASFFGTIAIPNYSIYLSYLADSITKNSRLLPQHQRTQHWYVPFHNFKTFHALFLEVCTNIIQLEANYTVVQWFLIPCY
jgi:hypothetical protein